MQVRDGVTEVSSPFRLVLRDRKLEHERAEAAVRSFREGKPEGPVRNSVWMGDGYVELSVFDSRVHLSGIFVLPDARRQGHGERYLRELLQSVDAFQAECQCAAAPFGAPGSDQMSARRLTSWYKQHGFEAVPGRKSFLIRPAQG
jgi:ribosomal protein S18 acetylase RimI-like enzyme